MSCSSLSKSLYDCRFHPDKYIGKVDDYHFQMLNKVFNNFINNCFGGNCCLIKIIFMGIVIIVL